MDLYDRWLRLIAVASGPPGSAEARHEALNDALGVGASITPDSVGCSITQLTSNGFYTPAASSNTALQLDLAQYRANDGPCVAACRDGRPHSIIVMTAETEYTGFTAAATAHNVRSSLSLPLAGTESPSALNLYAASTSAFESPHARNVAALLARCVTLLLPPTNPSLPASGVELASAQAANLLVARAQEMLTTRHALSSAAAFHRLTELSRIQQRSVIDIARDLIATDRSPITDQATDSTGEARQ